MKMKTCKTCKYMLRNIDDLDASTPLERLGTCQIMLPPFVTVKNSDRQVDIDRITCTFHTEIDDSAFGHTRSAYYTRGWEND